MTHYPKFFLNKGRILALWVLLTTIKDSLKFKLLAFWRKWTPFIDQKCTFEKVPKKLGRALPTPSFGQNAKEKQFFSGNLPLYSPVFVTTFYISETSFLLVCFLIPRQYSDGR